MKSLKKSAVKFAILVAILAPQIGLAGVKEAGGGDLDAVEFLMVAKEISTWMRQSKNIFAESDIANYAAALKEITERMDGGELSPLRFTNDDLTDDFGVSKMAVFNRIPASIVVNRKIWSKITILQRYQLAALELFGLAGIENRYEANSLIKTHFAELAAISNGGVPPLRQVQTFGVYSIEHAIMKVILTEKSLTISVACPTQTGILLAVATAPVKTVVRYDKYGQKYAVGTLTGSDEEIVTEGDNLCSATIRHYDGRAFYYEGHREYSKHNVVSVSQQGPDFWTLIK